MLKYYSIYASRVGGWIFAGPPLGCFCFCCFLLFLCRFCSAHPSSRISELDLLHSAVLARRCVPVSFSLFCFALLPRFRMCSTEQPTVDWSKFCSNLFVCLRQSVYRETICLCYGITMLKYCLQRCLHYCPCSEVLFVVFFVAAAAFVVALEGVGDPLLREAQLFFCFCEILRSFHLMITAIVPILS